jgi:hypothetical protein
MMTSTRNMKKNLRTWSFRKNFESHFINMKWLFSIAEKKMLGMIIFR